MGFAESLGAGLATAGGSVVGGVVSNLINQNQVENEATRNQFNLTHGISMRVKDAKRAGLHPLYALGAPAMTSSPITMQDTIGPALIQAGQNIGNILSRQDDASDKLKTDLELQLLRSNIEESDARAMLARSQASQNYAANIGGMGVRPEVPNTNFIGPRIEGQMPMSMGVGEGIIEGKPSPQISTKVGNPSMVAGLGPTQEERTLAPGFFMVVPRLEGESLEEILSEMNPLAFNGLLDLNQKIYGGNWKRDFTEFRYSGKIPKGNYLSTLEHGPRRSSVRRIMELPMMNTRNEFNRRMNKTLEEVKGMFGFGGREKSAQEKVGEAHGRFYGKEIK